MKTGYQTMKCGLLGEHLGHSFSPQIHKELCDYSYKLVELSREELGNFVKSGALDAFNVTIPYKKDVMPFLDEIAPEALAIGAVNTVVRKNGKLYGYNTDYFGFDYMLTSSGIEVSGKKAVVFGTGGASATVCAVLRDRGVRELVVIGIEDNTPETIAKHADAEIVANATPVGMYPANGRAPVSLAAFPKCEGVFDVIYNPTRTALVLDAEARGITAVNGLPMLVAQAVKAFEFFTGDCAEEGCIDRITAKIGHDTRNVILVGMPGCGKSTVGKKVARFLERPFFDADEAFTEMHGMTPACAIETLGEDKFRQMEHETLCELCKKSGAVIACGGGAVTREYNYAPLHQNGVILFLDRELDKLSTEGRPLSQRNSLTDLYNKRIASYHRFADLTVTGTEIPEKTAEHMVKALESYDYTCVWKGDAK